MTELLPCPFCGGEAKVVGEVEMWFQPACMNRGCACCWTDFYETKAEAIDAWNTRTFKALYEDGNLCRIVTDTDTYIPERTCSVTSEEYDDLLDVFTTHFSCGHFTIGKVNMYRYCPKCGAKVIEE